MQRQHLTRRIVLSAAVVGLAVLTALGGGEGVNAEGPSGSWPSKAAFQKQCEERNGTFVDQPTDNLTTCWNRDGSKEVCDQKGANCHYWDKPKSQQEPGSGSPFVGSTGEILEILPVEAAPTFEETLIGGGVVVEEIQILTNEPQPVAPGDQPLFAEAGTAISAPAEAVEAPAEAVETPAQEPMAAAPAEGVETPAEEPIPAASSEVVESPAEAPATLAEEPVAAEASEEQP